MSRVKKMDFGANGKTFGEESYIQILQTVLTEVD